MRARIARAILNVESPPGDAHASGQRPGRNDTKVTADERSTRRRLHRTMRHVDIEWVADGAGKRKEKRRKTTNKKGGPGGPPFPTPANAGDDYGRLTT
jgi:hypothetical protein